MGPGGARGVVVIGDTLLDIDVEGSVDRLCPDAPAPVLAVEGEHDRPGGAGLAAVLVAGRDVPVRLVTALQDDGPGQRLRRLLDGAVDVVAGPAEGGTVVKCRLRAGGRSMLRTDRGAARPEPGFAAGLDLDTALADAGAVLVSDYGRGVAADPDVRAALARVITRRVPVVWDPHPRGADPVPGATVVTPNLAEARGAAGGAPVPGSGVPAALELAARLLTRWEARSVAVTLGRSGAVVRHRHGACSAAPAPVVQESDPCGAGDHFAGGVAAALARGETVDDAVAEAVAGTADFIALGGGATVRREGARWTQPRGAGAAPRPAGTGLDAAGANPERVRAGGGTVVAAGGSFDVLHTGHTDTLAAARALGDCLLVLVNSDESVRRRAGPGGPVVPLAERVAALAALECVDAVAVFDADDPRRVLDVLRPDLWVKGGDHDPAELPETPLVRSWGGEVVAVPYRPARTTVSAPVRHPAGARARTRQQGAPQQATPQPRAPKPRTRRRPSP
ncbi:PfkB family carbohydrate kinase [Pseudonocardia xinjiangensis]|uniref:PfkB family carbohydrate kinase n=1 Tax=Pseudonocardia xinjiangensis TaxID=75289 RepID=UPI0031CDD106